MEKEPSDPKNNVLEITGASSTRLPHGRRPFALYFTTTRDRGDQLATFNHNDHTATYPVQAYSLTRSHRTTIQGNNLVLEQLQGGNINIGTRFNCPLPSNTADSRGIAFSPDGTLLVVTHFGTENLTSYSVSDDSLSDAETYQLPVQTRGPWGVAFSPDGSFVAIVHYGSSHLTFIPVRNKRLVITESVVHVLPERVLGPRAIVFSMFGTEVAIANYGSDSVLLVRLREGTTTIEGFSHRSLPSNSHGPVAVLFSRLGDAIFTANYITSDITSFKLKPNRAAALPQWVVYLALAYMLFAKDQSGKK